MPWQWHAAMAAYWQRRDDERIALPPRPDDAAPGHPWVRITVLHVTSGSSTEIELRIPTETGRRRPRSDQSQVAVDGEVVAEREGLTDTLKRVRKAIGRRITRLQRDEIDRMAAGLV